MGLEVYALAPQRSEAVSDIFRSAWLDGFEESADEYEVPENSDRPEAIYTSVDDLIQRLVATPAEGYSVYWHNLRPGRIRSGMLMFTTDGALVVGLSIAGEDAGEAARVLSELARTVGAEHGYVTSDERPPDTARDFLVRTPRAAIRIPAS
jgi:hypothetical protein